MIIILHGENDFFSRRKLNEIIAQYRLKHKTGLSFFSFDPALNGFDFSDFKSAVETVAMFSEKKLIVLKNLVKEIPVDYLKEKKLKEDIETVIVFYESIALDQKKNKDIAWLFEKSAISQESKNLEGSKLSSWIYGEVERRGGKISEDALGLLAASCGNDLWRLDNEINKLLAFSPSITKENVSLLIPRNIEGDVFNAVSHLIGKNTKDAVEQFARVIRQGEDPIKTFGLIVFQYRALLKVRSALDESEQFAPDRAAKSLRLHPFVVKKTLPFAKKYATGDLRRIYKLLLKTDLELKTGEVTFGEFVENLALGLR